MRPGQPLGWHAYAEGWLNFPLGRLLDYGCGNGLFVGRVVARCEECHAVDVDPASVAEAAKIKGVRASVLQPQTGSAGGCRLPFDDAFFDTVIIIEVIEHVPDERAILRELARVLKPGGKMLLTTPHKGLLTWLDPANLKFVFPRLHRFVYKTVLRRGEYYEARFGAKRQAETGLFGSVAAGENAWHRHYKFREIRALAPPELETLNHAVYFPAMRAFWLLKQVFRVLTLGRYADLPWPLTWASCRLSHVESRLGDQLVVLFRKGEKA